jgi:diaminopropionate ammonia-lyase
MPATIEYSHRYNNNRLDNAGESAAAICVENLSKWTEAVEEIHTRPEYEPQPLRSLSNQVQHMGIRKLFCKDESKRFGVSLASFKALGASYAVYKILANEVFSQTGIRPTSVALWSGKFKDITQRVTVCRHGRESRPGSRLWRQDFRLWLRRLHP